jgi:hypothetical protein
MKVYIVGLFCFFISVFSYADENIFELKMELYLNGQHISSPRVITKEGEKAVITQENSSNLKTELEVIVKEEMTPNRKIAIMMDFTISQVSKDGVKTILSKPRILSIYNEQAKIIQSDEDGNEVLNLSVIANKK